MGNPHMVVVPCTVQGHVIPLMELSQRLAKYGFTVTFVNSEHNEWLVKNASALKGNNLGDRINMVLFSDGLQAAEEEKMPGKSSGDILRVMTGKVEDLIEQMNKSDNDSISCIIAEQSLGWALELAEKKGIRRAAFCPAAAAMLALGFSIPKLIEDGIIDENELSSLNSYGHPKIIAVQFSGTPTKRKTIKLSPNMPTMDTANFVWTCLGSMEAQKNIFDLMVRNNKSIKLTDWLQCNSMYDLEPAAFSLALQILPVGPLSASNRFQLNSAGNFWPKDSTWLEWLDQQPPQSIIYVAFGSVTVLDPTQFQELVLGLELTNRPFLLVVRADTKANQPSEVFTEEFQDRVDTSGKVTSWAPQQEVLAHPAVACFLSHCGWNSTMEGVSNGVPILCRPSFADKFINQSYICDVWKIGLGLDKNEEGKITRDEIKHKLEQVLKQ